MIIVAVANSKGGVGKTTLCLALAVRAAEGGARVRVVDLDPQKSMVALFERRGGGESPAIVAPDADSLAEALDELEGEAVDWLFVDGAPGALELLADTIERAHFLVVPIKPSMLDLVATQDAVALAKEAGVPFLCVVNDVQAREKIADSTRATLRKFAVPVAETQIVHRVAHVTGATLGRSAAESGGGRDKAAAAEIDALWREIEAAARRAARARPPVPEARHGG